MWYPDSLSHQTHTWFATSPQLCLYTTWHYTKTETRHWRAEAVTIGDVFFRASSTKLLISGKHGCVHVQRQRDVTSNTYSDLNTQPAFSQPLTILRGRQHMFSVFTARRVYTMHSADYAMAGCLPSVCYTPVLCLNGYTYPGSFFSTIG